jgi:hypothetical protein
MRYLVMMSAWLCIGLMPYSHGAISSDGMTSRTACISGWGASIPRWLT